MKLMEICILFLACFVFLIGRPFIEKRAQIHQYEHPQEEVAQDDPENKEIRVVYKARSLEEDAVADILWLNRAAGIALEHGSPYFNIVSQEMRKRFVESQDKELTVIDGVIELQHDSMESDYDAHEISSLRGQDFIE